MALPLIPFTPVRYQAFFPDPASISNLLCLVIKKSLVSLNILSLFLDFRIIADNSYRESLSANTDLGVELDDGLRSDTFDRQR